MNVLVVRSPCAGIFQFVLHFLALADSLTAPSSKVGPETWRGDVNDLFRAESTMVTYSQHPEQPEKKRVSSD